MSAVAVFGGYGTFGARVTRDLARRGHRVIVAGRDVERAFVLAASLPGGSHEAVRADLADGESCRRAVRGASVVAVCAGPFSAIGDAPARAALAAGAHYVDIADDRGYIRDLRALDGEFVRAGRCAAYGCSSLPAVSSALALSLLDDAEPPSAARVTLFIGNDNPKGSASVRAMVERLENAFRDGARIAFPAPIGPRTAYTFPTPELDLFPTLLGVSSVAVRVAFELPVVNGLLGLLARTPLRLGARTAAVLTRAGSLAPRMGTSSGAVLVELTWADGRRRARALVADEDGQRMAALPCAMAAHVLATSSPVATGVRPPTDVVAPAALLAELQAAGMRVVDA